MKNSSILSTVFYALVVLNFNIELNGQTNNVCVFCQKYFDTQCEPSGNSMSDSDLDKGVARKQWKGEKSNPELIECLPKRYIVTGDLKSFSCAVVKKLGCNLIAGPNMEHMYELACVGCGQWCKCKQWTFKDIKNIRSAASRVGNGFMLATGLTVIISLLAKYI